MNKGVRVIILLGIVLMVGIALAGIIFFLGGKGLPLEVREVRGREERAPTKDKRPVIYTALPEPEATVYIKAFEKKTGIEVDYIRKSAGEMLNLINAQKDDPVASVMYGGPGDTYFAAQDLGLLQRYKSSYLKEINQEFIDEEGYWSPIYLGVMGFVSNLEVLEKAGASPPTSWSDLLKKEFRGLISMANPASSGTGYTIEATLIQLMGKEKAFKYMKKLNKNISKYTNSGFKPGELTGLGETGVGILFAHDILKLKERGYPVVLTFPKEGTGYEIGGVALIRNAPQVELAKRFIDFVLSKEGQDLYSQARRYRIPTNSLSTVPEGAVSLEAVKVIDYDHRWAGKNRMQLTKEWNETILGE